MAVELALDAHLTELALDAHLAELALDAHLSHILWPPTHTLAHNAPPNTHHT